MTFATKDPSMRAGLSRRLFLGSAAVTVGLPFLASAFWTRRAGAAACAVPRRFVSWFVPNGLVMPDWTPATGGTTWAATKISAPLEPLRKKILILTGLDHQATAEPASPPGGHGAGTGCFLNMIPVNGHETDKTRTSLDQRLLSVLNTECGAPLLPSLQIGVQGDNGLCDRASCDFSRAISWKNGVPLPNIYDPKQAFDRLFAGFSPMATSADAKQRLAERKSVLDRVLGQAQSLATKLSPSDKLKLDEYTTSLRELEVRIDKLAAGGSSCMVPPAPAASPPLNFDRGITPSSILKDHVPTFIDLMAIALQCDITRTITFMLGNGTSNNDYQFVTGSSTPHHGTSHHGGSASLLAKLTQIDVWEMQQAAALLTKLDGMVQADGKSLLDYTTFYLSSDVGDGNTHNHWDMPVLLAGGSASGLKVDGRHINYTPALAFPRPLVGPRSPTHTGRVFISILNAHGIPDQTFGEATGGPLPELMA
jgi:hypothetical protein